MNRVYDVCFVFGAARSGTTWTQLLLSKFPGVATVRETHLAPNYLSPLWQSWLADKNRTQAGLTFSLRDPEFVLAMRAFATTIFDEIHRGARNAKILVEKTPRHVLNLDLLQHIQPGAYFIHVVRDPRAVVASQLAVQKEPWSFLSDGENYETMAMEWSRRVRLAIDAQSKLGERFATVRFEELKGNLAEEVKRLLMFLNIESPPDVQERLLRKLKKIDVAYLNKHRSRAPRNSVLHEERDSFFRRGETESWKEELTMAQIARIEELCEAEMRHFNYVRA